MTDSTTTPPDGWSEVAAIASASEETYVYDLGGGDRIFVGLTSSPNDPERFRLEVSSIEPTATVQRHDFVVTTADERRAGIEDVISFMEIVSETISAGEREEERLFVAVQRCIEEFNRPTAIWDSIVSR